jgi:hypothetical protein
MFFGSAEQLPASIECENASPHFLRAKNTPIYAMMFGGDPGIISLAFVPESKERTSPEGRTREENKMCYTTSGRHKHCQHLQCLGRHPPCLTRHPPDTHTHTHTHTHGSKNRKIVRAQGNCIRTSGFHADGQARDRLVALNNQAPPKGRRAPEGATDVRAGSNMHSRAQDNMCA